jgi:hypothetical protein
MKVKIASIATKITRFQYLVSINENIYLRHLDTTQCFPVENPSRLGASAGPALLTTGLLSQDPTRAK